MLFGHHKAHSLPWAIPPGNSRSLRLPYANGVISLKVILWLYAFGSVSRKLPVGLICARSAVRTALVLISGLA